MMKKKKLKIGESVKLPSMQKITLEEVFAADGVRWAKCTTFRKSGSVMYNGNKANFIDKETVYLTDLEWLKIRKKSLQ